MNEKNLKQLLNYTECEVSVRNILMGGGPPSVFLLIAQELFINGMTETEFWEYCKNNNVNFVIETNVSGALRSFEKGFYTPEMFPFRLQLKTPLKTKSDHPYKKCVRYKEIKLPSK
jgi:hypothetical protein